MKNITVWIALVMSFAAISTAIGLPIYIDYEHKQALERQSNWESKAAEARRTPPTYDCSDDHYRVTDYSGALPVSIPVWTENGVVECSADKGFSVDGESITQEEAEHFATENIRKHGEEVSNRSTPTSFPVIDLAHIAQSLNDWYSELSPEEQMRVKKELSPEEQSLLIDESKCTGSIDDNIDCPL
jgi:hypothetical protein